MNYKHFSKILMRTPSLPLSKLNYPPIRSTDSSFLEGLYLSSPEFISELDKYDSKSDKEKESILKTLQKYWNRCCSRCTPYGTFAGSTLIKLHESTSSLIVNKNDNHLRKIRLDMNYISSLLPDLQRDIRIKRNTCLFVNSSLYEIGDEYRYAEFIITNNLREYDLSSISKDVFLEFIIEKAKKGITFSELAEGLVISFDDINIGEAETFVEELWEEQILIPAFEPPVTGEDPLDHLIKTLGEIDPNGFVKKLSNIKQVISLPGLGINFYRNVDTLLDETMEIKRPKNTVQVDLFLSFKHNLLEKSIIESIISQIEDLFVFNKQIINSHLDIFKNAFIDRYERQEIPLVIALDPDIGLGYGEVTNDSVGPNDYINDLFLVKGSQIKTERIDPIFDFILKKYEDYILKGNDLIEITSKDVEALAYLKEDVHFSNSLSIMGSLLKEGKKKNNFTFDFHSMSGPSGANLLGRFGHGSERMENFVKEVIHKEQEISKEVIFAEVVHLPQARVGNVLLRPLLRNYEIPYVGQSGMNLENQITIEDLVICIKRNKVILKSRRLNKEVRPRLSTAHNYSVNSLPIYKFLCDLQHQGLNHPIIWNWGILSNFRKLPRVVYKNIILKKAHWKIGLEDTEKGSQTLYQIKEKLGIPQKVTLKQFDNQLLIDFDRKIDVVLLNDYLRKYKVVELEEFLFSEDNCYVKDSFNNSYTNELIIPIYNNDQYGKETFQFKTPGSNKNQVQRVFLSNSEWVFFKLYSGVEVAEEILKKHLYPFVLNYRNILFDRFFFMRYRDDTGCHLRVRFHCSELQNSSKVKDEFIYTLQPLVNNKLLHKVSLDSYHREIERYGNETIKEAESLFFYDSVCVLKIIRLADLIEDKTKFLIFAALKTIDSFLNDFNLSFTEKHLIINSCHKSFFKEFGGDKRLQKQLNNKYRILKKDIEAHLNNNLMNDDIFLELIDILQERSISNKREILLVREKTKINVELYDFIMSCLHMFMNRLFSANQRKYELLTYSLLERNYYSMNARQKLKNVN